MIKPVDPQQKMIKPVDPIRLIRQTWKLLRLKFVPHLGHGLHSLQKIRGARFLLVQHTKTGENVPNDHKICQNIIIYT
jgi:hypothetical protein